MEFKELRDYLNKEIYPFLEKKQCKKIKNTCLAGELERNINKYMTRQREIAINKTREESIKTIDNYKDIINELRERGNEVKRYPEKSVID